jgi:hypothetical protein
MGYHFFRNAERMKRYPIIPTPKGHTMAIDPKTVPEAFARFSAIRRQEATSQRLELLRLRRQSYEANIHHRTLQLRGMRTMDQPRSSIMTSLMSLQTKLVEVANEIQELERLYTLMAGCSDEQIAEEFRRICEMPQVLEIRSLGQHDLAVIVRAWTTYQGHIYDLGDWVIPIHQKLQARAKVNAQVYELRTGVIKGECSQAAYRLSTKIFCFGTNGDPINTYFKLGKYHAGIQLMVYALSSVNEGDVAYIPTTFTLVA